MLKYFDDFVGKDLEIGVIAELMLYMSVNLTPIAMPLGVLLSCLMTYGNLGEQFELTAIKSSGISLLRTLRPVFVFVLFLTIGMFFFNNNIVPMANLKFYSMLWDIKQKKPTMDIRAGQFYTGIPNYSIKVAKKMADGITMKDIIIYDHNNTDGNQRVILADSARMYTIMNDRYLLMELYDGSSNSEERSTKSKGRNALMPINQFFRNDFSKMNMVFSLASFDMSRTDLELFSSNKAMKTLNELSYDIDSMENEIRIASYNIHIRLPEIFDKHLLSDFEIPQELTRSKFKKDTTVVIKPMEHSLNSNRTQYLLQNRLHITVKDGQLTDSSLVNIDKYFADRKPRRMAVEYAINKARFAKNAFSGESTRAENILLTMYRFVIEKYRKFTYAFTCITMFLIGAPLGSIIKRGGLGLPVLISIGFFITNYVLTIVAEKWAKQGFVDGEYATWFSNLILLPIGFYFLKQARNDARLFDSDFYLVVWDKIKIRFRKEEKRALQSA